MLLRDEHEEQKRVMAEEIRVLDEKLVCARDFKVKDVTRS